MKKEHQPYFLPYQIDWLNDKSQIKIWEKSRRIGATYVQSYEDVEDCLRKRVPSVWFTSADETAAKEYIDYCKQWAELFNLIVKETGEAPILEDDKAVKTLWIDFANGTKITAVSSSPNKLRSKGGKAVWDEAAHHKDPMAMWAALSPVALWGYPVRIMSTHKGSSMFNQLCTRVKNGELEWGHHHTDLPEAVEQGLVDKIYQKKTTPQERKKWLDDVRKNCVHSDVWNEEYLVIPVDESTAFMPYELISSCEKEPRDILCEIDNIKGDFYFGMDIGRKRDLTVIWINEKDHFQNITRKVFKLERAPFAVQWDILKSIIKKKNLRRGCIDATGLGMQMAEDAVNLGGKYRIEAITFTAKVKEELAYHTRNQFEDRLIIIPADDIIRSDIHSTRKVVTAAGNIRFDVDATEAGDGHADHFWALSLALHAAKGTDAPLRVTTKKRSNPFSDDFIKDKVNRLLKGF